MNGGYVMVDGKGLDLTANEAQTIDGLFRALKEAFNTGKPVYGYNCVWGVNSDAPLSPIAFFVQIWNANLIVCTSSILKIDVTSEDSVTITSLV